LFIRASILAAKTRGGRQVKRFMLFVTLLTLGIPAACAQGYPSRPIKVVVPYVAGGLPDTMARLAGQKMGEGLGQQLVVENRGGAGGIIGTAEVAKAAPDG
jgi:tripartite-type tricarboxylate transporter receptor subunit TctC